MNIKSHLISFLNSMKSSLSWVFFISRRFAKVDRKGASAVTTTLASLGICFGVLTLITVISVMNGFQHSFIDVILEISSYHIRTENFQNENDKPYNTEFENFCLSEKMIRSFVPFYEAESLMVSQSGREAAAMIKALPDFIYNRDPGFKKYVNVLAGKFDITDDQSIVIGAELARRLGVRLGGKVNLYALSGGSDVDLFSADRVFTVTGIFHTGYSDINASFAFINLDVGKKYFGKNASLIYGIKLNDSSNDSNEIARIKAAFPQLKSESWRSYNRSFFGALQVEKNILMFLVFLIFVVVAINIFNGMRRLVFERKEEISVLSAFGGRKSSIQSIFVLQGFITGFLGSIPGAMLGLFLSVNMDKVFFLISKVSYYAELLVMMLLNPQNGEFIRENPMFMLYASIPPKIFAGEVIMITLFGIFSSFAASCLASRGVLKMSVAEVMRDE